MVHTPKPGPHAAPVTPFHRRRLSRREALAIMTGLAGGMAILPSGIAVAMRQDGGTPAPQPAPATPVLGEQSDGTVTWRVQVGYMDMENGLELMAFFPEEITINAGDRIFFEMMSFHTVTFLGDAPMPALFVPEAEASGTPAAADGGRWVANPMAAFPSGPPVHDGASYLNSGIPDPTVPPFVVEFTTAGTFEYICLVHPDHMKATVVVQEQGAERPMDQAGYDAQAATQIEALVAEGVALAGEYAEAGQATPASGTGTVWDVAVGVGGEQVQVMQFLPGRLEISAGDTVRWTNHGGTEPHTVTFPGENPPPEVILIEPQPAGPPLLVLNPEVIEPAGEATYIPASFANAGWLQEDASEFPEGIEFPVSWEQTFTEPGEYLYYCALHGGPGGEGEPALVGMVGTIVVS